MAKKITFSHKGREYTLAFDRESIQRLDALGFLVEEISSMPMTMIPKLFRGAFFKFHSSIKGKLVDEIWESLTNRQILVKELLEMYNEGVNSLFDEPEETAEGEETGKSN